MAVKTVRLYLGFAEDNPRSMEVYAANLASSLSRVAGDAFEVEQYRPSLPTWLTRSRIPKGIKVRYGRYWSYRRQARRNQGTINHVLDQSYAHLLNVIDPARSVITVHDLIPVLGWGGTVPGLSYPHYPLLYKWIIASLHKARAIIAVSESTKRDLIRQCGLPDSQITVVHNGIDSRFVSLEEDARAAARASFGLPDRDTHVVLITGGQSYKNHLTSFRVVARLQQATSRPVQLVWLGADDVEYEKCVGTVELARAVTRLQNLDPERLVGLYNSVDCLLFPSWYEGFGWPPMEAMACGTPVVTSNAAALVEVGRDAALTASPDDIDGLTEAVRLLLEDPALRHDYIHRGILNARRFTWDRCALGVLKVYEQVLSDAA